MAESKYVAVMKKLHGTGNFKAFDRKGAMEANRQHYPDYDECGVPLQYLMGWALAPPYVCRSKCCSSGRAPCRSSLLVPRVQ